jgi:hypothetical protein
VKAGDYEKRTHSHRLSHGDIANWRRFAMFDKVLAALLALA